jgi:autotransporter-associated beta strand protein
MKTRTSLILCALAVLGLVAVQPAHAATITWGVAGSGDWNTTTANWTGGATTFTDGGVDDVIFDNIAGGTITISAGMSPLTTTVSAASGTYTFSGGPIDSGSLTKSNGGTLVLSSANTYAGGTTVTGGSLTLSNKNGLGSGTVTLAGGTNFKTQDFEGNNSGGALPNAFVLSGGKVNVDVSFGDAKDIWINTPVSGPGGFFITGSDQRNPGLMLSGAKTFEGGVTLGNGSKVTIDNAASLGTGTLRSEIKGGWNEVGLKADANIDTGGGVPNAIEIATDAFLRVNTNGNNLLLSGKITGDGKLYKTNSGTLTLSGANTYKGDTKVDAGTLQVGNNLALQNSALDTSGAGSLAFSAGINTPTFGGLTGSTNLTLPSNVTALTLNPGKDVTKTYSGILGSATPGMTLTKTGLGTQVLASANTYTGDTTVSEGTLSVMSAFFDNDSTVYILNGAVLNLNHAAMDDILYLYLGGEMRNVGIYDASTPGGYLSGTGSLFVLAPEPATLALLGLGGLGLILNRKRR